MPQHTENGQFDAFYNQLCRGLDFQNTQTLYFNFLVSTLPKFNRQNQLGFKNAPKHAFTDTVTP